MRFKLHVPFRSPTAELDRRPKLVTAARRNDADNVHPLTVRNLALHDDLLPHGEKNRPRNVGALRSALNATATRHRTSEPVTGSQPARKTFGQALEDAAPSNLISCLRGASIPAELSAFQKRSVIAKLARFHEDVLTDSPFIDVHGNSVDFRLADADSATWNDPYLGVSEPIPARSKAVLENVFDDYPSHRKWQADHLEVRTIGRGDVDLDQQELVGQEGVYANRPIAKGTVVSVFDGMLIEDEKDVANDKALRKMASCDHYFSKATPDTIVQGMGWSMKFNAATRSGDQRNNLKTSYVQATRMSNQQKIQVIVFRAAQDIQAGEHMCFAYDINASRQ